MDLAWISLAALVVVVIVSCTSTVNAGLLSIALAWLLAMYVAPALGTPLTMKELVSGFPTDLCLTLIGVTLLFSQARANGTLEKITRIAVRGCRGDLGLIPIMFFFLAVILSSIGAGNIAGIALVAPLAMTMAHRVGIPALPMAVIASHGALAGALSPLAPTGIIANNLMESQLELVGFGFRLYVYSLLANAVVGVGGYLLLGGWRLFGKTSHEPKSDQLKTDEPPTWNWRNSATALVIGSLIVGAIGFQVHIGMGAFAAAVILTVIGAADERKAIGMIPWGVILMVCGVTMLTSLLEKTGGLDRFAELVSRVSTPRTVPGIIGFASGVLSVYSSTSGVVLPVIFPAIPKLIAQLGGGDPFAIVCSVAVTGHLVDSSPLSTIGALCIASAPAVEGRQVLFNQMLAWGLSMAVIGALLCQALSLIMRH
jgi:Na+/H+ antiporter NhaD/arsenite permease-like protein